MHTRSSQIVPSLLAALLLLAALMVSDGARSEAPARPSMSDATEVAADSSPTSDAALKLEISTTALTEISVDRIAGDVSSVSRNSGPSFDFFRDAPPAAPLKVRRAVLRVYRL